MTTYERIAGGIAGVAIGDALRFRWNLKTAGSRMTVRCFCDFILIKGVGPIV